MPSIAENVNKIYPSPTAAEASEYYGKIALWQQIFSGEPEWKTVTFTTLDGKKTRRMDMLNAAKLLCDSFSTLTFAEQCDISVSDEEYQKFLNETLNTAGFWEAMPEWIAKAYALGGGALKVFAEHGEIGIDYVTADGFFPVKWHNKIITAGVFQTVIKLANYYYTLLELQEPGRITHKLYKSQSSDVLGAQCSLSEAFDGLHDEINLGGAEVPLFAYFRPAVTNNILNNNVPLGISVFANSIETLHVIDIIFDSFGREFVLGKKRIIVPAGAVNEYTGNDGVPRQYFDTNDEVFVALNAEDTDGLKIFDNSAELRTEPHIAALNAQLDILCAQTGLSPGTLSFDKIRGMKTAYEVKSQDNKTASTIKADKNVLNETLEALVRAIFTLAQSLGLLHPRNVEIAIGWKDNVDTDDSTLIDDNVKLVSAGLKSKLSAIMAVMKCDEETAQKELDRINAENPALSNVGDIF